MMKQSCLKGLLGFLILLLALYPAYKIKSVMGIDLIQGYHTPDLIKMSIKAIAHKVTS